VIALFLISIIGIAGTVTKTYTFSSGEVVSASKFNTNFDTLFTLVNGNLDDNNISSLSASKITSGVFDNSTIPKPANHITIFSRKLTTGQDGNIGGRSGADAICNEIKDSELINIFNNSCSNVRALISVSSSDEIRDFPDIYSVPTNVKVRSQNGMLISDNWSGLFATADGGHPSGLHGNLSDLVGIYKDSSTEGARVWTGSSSTGEIANYHCIGWTSNSSGENGGTGGLEVDNIYALQLGQLACNALIKKPFYCICY
jgi:hypothetical protein